MIQEEINTVINLLLTAASYHAATLTAIDRLSSNEFVIKEKQALEELNKYLASLYASSKDGFEEISITIQNAYKLKNITISNEKMKYGYVFSASREVSISINIRDIVEKLNYDLNKNSANSDSFIIYTGNYPSDGDNVSTFKQSFKKSNSKSFWTTTKENPKLFILGALLVTSSMPICFFDLALAAVTALLGLHLLLMHCDQKYNFFNKSDFKETDEKTFSDGKIMDRKYQCNIKSAKPHNLNLHF